MKQTAHILMRLAGVLLLLWSAMVTVLFFSLTWTWASNPAAPVSSLGAWLVGGWWCLGMGIVCAVTGTVLDQFLQRDALSDLDAEELTLFQHREITIRK